MQYFVNGIVIGSTYGLISVAYSLIYGVAGVVNFAFGGIFMFGAFGTLVAMGPRDTSVSHLFDSLGLPVVLAIPIGLVVGGLVGLAVERVSYRPLRSQPTLTLLISSLTALIMLQSLGQFLFGAGETQFPNLVFGAPLTAAGAIITRMDLLVILVGGAATGFIWLLATRSRWGRATRAVAESRDTSSLMGIDVDRTIMMVFFAGSVMAALSGILYGSLFQTASPTMGYQPGLLGLVAAVVGGIGNVLGAFVGGLALGLVETYVAAYVPNGSAYQDVFAFVALVLFLWVRPQGIFGTQLGDRA